MGHPASLDDTVLAGNDAQAHSAPMFMVSEDDATAIRDAYDRAGEFAAAVELRRRFPGIADNEEARRCARTIAGWSPEPLPPPPVPRLRPKKV